jgi:hypothetical protein
MEPSSAAAGVNLLAILVSAISGFAIGGLWYGPILGAAWMSASGMTADRIAAVNKGLTYGCVFVLNVVAAFSLAMFIGPRRTLQFGLFAGFMTGATFVSTALGVIYLFEQKPLRLWLINAGYQTLNFTIMGAVIGAWH